MKTTIHYISRIDKEGPVELLYEILKSTGALGVRNIVITQGFKNAEYFRKFEKLGVEIHFCSRFNFLKLNYIVRCALSRFGVINYHSYCTAGLLYNLIIPIKVRKIHSCLVESGIQAVAMNGLIKGTLIEKLNYLGYKLVNVLVAGSNGISKSLEDVSSQLIIIIPNSVSRAKSHHSGFKHHRKYAVTVCRFSPEKNILGLIKSYRNLIEPSFDLFLIGDGKLRNEIEDAASGCSNIHLVGFVDDFEKYFLSAEFYVSFSKIEGLPMSVLTAMAYGLPLILSDIGGHDECVDLNGHLVDPEDLNQFQIAVDDVLKNRSLYSRRSIINFEERFSPECLGEGYNRTYE